MQKPKIYADLPEFDQLTQAVIQTDEVDMGDYIQVNNMVIDIEVSEDEVNGGDI